MEFDEHAFFDRLELLVETLFDRIARLLDDKLEDLRPKHLYSPREAAYMLSTSPSSMEQMINRGDVRVIHHGAKRLISHEELLRVSKKDLPFLWPEKGSGKTRRSP
jgi:predicted RNA-binding protein YlqC (UPF0109 family)